MGICTNLGHKLVAGKCQESKQNEWLRVMGHMLVFHRLEKH